MRGILVLRRCFSLRKSELKRHWLVKARQVYLTHLLGVPYSVLRRSVSQWITLGVATTWVRWRIHVFFCFRFLVFQKAIHPLELAGCCRS
jgi:hypothetical protein